MTPIAEMVERMLAENAPAAAVVAAIRAIELVTRDERDKALLSRVTKRDAAKQRQARHRKRLKEQKLAREAQANDGADRNANVTRDVTQTPLSDCVVLSSLLPEKPLKESKRERMRARGTRMEPGAPLSDEHRALILAEGIQDPEKLWAEFVDYWSEVPGQRGVKIGWTGTLRNRCRDVIKRGFNQNGKPKSPIIQAADDLIRKIASFDGPAKQDFDLRDAEGSPAPRLLSHR